MSLWTANSLLVDTTLSESTAVDELVKSSKLEPRSITIFKAHMKHTKTALLQQFEYLTQKGEFACDLKL